MADEDLSNVSSVEEDPQAFLRKIHELKQRKDLEDAQRVESIESQIQKDRELRAIRRAERTRSLSPEKSSATTSYISPTTDAKKMADEPSSPPATATTLSRSGTLSWQQRPKSSSGRRPLSMIAAENAARSPRGTPEPATEDGQELSRAQIAEQLAGRDPAWFRQTADRGIGSAAYRRSEEDLAEPSPSTGRMKLPGMARDVPTGVESPSSPPPEDILTRSTSPSRASSIRGSAAWSGSRYSNTTNASDAGSLRIKSSSPSVMDAPKLDPPTLDRQASRTSRPPSPTKGMGGFVESAMMKRADSVSKRWSQQGPPGLTRQSSTASNRSSYIGPSTAGLTRLDRPSSSLSRDNSLEPGGSNSRPGSSHSNTTVMRAADESAVETGRDVFVKPALPHHSRSKSVASISVLTQGSPDTSSPSSPSKRWSPTKSSWLESALTKTEEKPKTPTPAQTQPSWMAELNKAKQSRTTSPTKELETPVAPETIKPVALSRDIKAEHFPALTKPKSPPLIKPKSPPPFKAKSPPPDPAAKPFVIAKEKPEVLPKPSSPSPSSPSSSIRSSVDTAKSPIPGKFDFRANLKSRQMQNDNSGKSEPEFKNALGKLKRTQTEKFVAPDTLKDNILRGKAGLSLTGGPAKRERVDELKDSLIKTKAAMQAKAASGEAPKRPEKPANMPSTPEALAKRNALQRSQSSKDAVPKTESSTPEAIARMKSLKEKSKPAPPEKPSSPPSKTSSSPPLPLKPVRSDNLDTVLARKTSPDATPSKSSIQTTLRSTNADQKPQPFALPGMAKPGVSSKLADRFNPALLGVLARGPPAVGQSGRDSTSTGSVSKSVDTPPAPTEPLEHKTKGRAKGPKRRAPTKQVQESSPTTPARQATSVSKIAPPVASLSRTSSGESTKSADKPAVVEPFIPLVKGGASAYKAVDQPFTPIKHSRNSSASFPAISLVKSKDVLQSSPKQSGIFDQTTASSEKSPPLKAKPVAPIKSPLLSEKTAIQRKDEPESVSILQASSPPKSQSQNGRTPSHEQDKSWNPIVPTSTSTVRPLPSVPSTKSPSIHQERAVDISPHPLKRAGIPTPPSTAPKDSPAASDQESSNVSVKNAASLWGRPSEATPSSPGRPPSPVKLPTRRDEEKAMVNAGLMAPPEVPSLPKKPLGLGLGISDSTHRPASSVAKPADRSPNKLPISPPLSADGTTKPSSIKSTTITVKEQPSPRQPSRFSKQLPNPPESPIPHTSEASRLFTDFFDDSPVIARDDDMDTMSILESYPVTDDSVRTIRMQMHELGSDGKFTTVPSHQEHILFEESMYICTHVFEANGLRTTEVYLWAGSGVPEAAVEDAQLFARGAAKDNNGKLLTFRQGEETPRFLQALGGIVITFRGARSKTFLGIPNKFVLCGRRHVGHICFDEVDFSLHSFFSGFPYLISSNSRLYLWQGSGCHQEELSSARLITMDVSPMPDLVEIKEGNEPASFFSLFPPLPKYPKNTIPPSANHWCHKAKHDKYRCRLFRVEQNDNPRGSTATLQVSNFLSNVIARRPSWSSLTGQRSPTEEQPKTPTTPRSPARGRPPTGTPLQSSIATRIVEIAPFTQRDVAADRIYVLDAFFEIYVIIGPLAQSQSFAFATALHFAEDYRVHAATAEDRPFLPFTHVVLEGVPRDMKPCFRQWRDEENIGGTEALIAGKIRRGKSLRVVGLDAALAATRER